MNTNYRKRNPGDALLALLRGRKLSRGATWGIMIIGALLAFELFNYSTTEFALNDVLGNLKFAGIRWATILAIAFCGIDFAGIARMFTPEQGADEPAEVWYLFGAWLLAAAMNATLTWWGVSVAIVNNSSLGGGVVISDATLTKAVPVFVAVMVWLIRVLIIGTFSVAGERLFSQDNQRNYRPAQTSQQRAPVGSNSVLRPASTLGRPAAKPMTQASFNSNRAEPTYHNLNYTAKPQQQNAIGFYDPASRDQ